MRPTRTTQEFPGLNNPNSLALAVPPLSAPSVGDDPGSGIIYYDGFQKQFLVSLGGSAFQPLGAGSIVDDGFGGFTWTVATVGGPTFITMQAGAVPSGIGFFGAAPGYLVTARPGQITDNTTGTVGNAIGTLAGADTVSLADLQDAMATLLARINFLEQMTFQMGLTF